MTVAKSLQHDAAIEHVSGSARYVDDIPTPSNTLHAVSYTHLTLPTKA